MNEDKMLQQGKYQERTFVVNSNKNKAMKELCLHAKSFNVFELKNFIAEIQRKSDINFKANSESQYSYEYSHIYC